MKKIRIILVGLVITAWVYPSQAQVPITQEMVIHPDNAVVKNGNVKIYGKNEGKEAGFTFKNILGEPVTISFEAKLTGEGTECFQRKRKLWIGETIYMLDRNVFNLSVSNIADTVNFLFADGCASGYIPGQGWENVVNVELNNFMVTTGNTEEWLSIDELEHWIVEGFRLSNNLNMEGADTLIVDSTEVVILKIGFVQPLIRTLYEDQLDPITFTRGDTLLDWFFTIDPDSGVWIGDSAFVSIAQDLELELGNWAWSARPLDTGGRTAKQCNWQPFRIEQSSTEPTKNPPSIVIQVQMELRRKE